MKKLALLVAVAIGYVLGTRAGRARYEQIRRQAEKVWHTEPVQSTVEKAQETAKHAAADVGHRVAESAKDAAHLMTEKVKTAADFAAEDRPSPAEATSTGENLHAVAEDLAEEADVAAAAADAEVAFGGDQGRAEDLAAASNQLSTEAEDVSRAADAADRRADAEAAFGGDDEGDRA